MYSTSICSNQLTCALLQGFLNSWLNNWVVANSQQKQNTEQVLVHVTAIPLLRKGFQSQPVYYGIHVHPPIKTDLIFNSCWKLLNSHFLPMNISWYPRYAYNLTNTILFHWNSALLCTNLKADKWSNLTVQETEVVSFEFFTPGQLYQWKILENCVNDTKTQDTCVLGTQMCLHVYKNNSLQCSVPTTMGNSHPSALFASQYSVSWVE